MDQTTSVCLKFQSIHFLNGGITYIRWGKSTCPTGTGREIVYSGITAGSIFNQAGGGSNYLCLPKVPEYTLPYDLRDQSNRNHIHGTEYESPVKNTKHQHNVPCAVCYVSTRSTVMMTPAKTSCPSNWTREYYGYLMSSYRGFQRTVFECIDKDLESIAGSHRDTNGAMLYHTEIGCNSIPCPPYDSRKELTCVVCSI